MIMSQSVQRRGQPMFILSEDSERTRGEDAQSANIAAGKAVSNSVRTTLGPRGMDKMLVSDSGDVVITNDGATILKEMDIEHPAAQMIVEVATTQEEEVGDGTTTASVLAGELLSRAEDLLDDDVHPTAIVEGYHEAVSIAQEAIDEQVLDEDIDDDLLENVAVTSMTGKGTGDIGAAPLAETVVGAIRMVEGEDGVKRDNVQVRTQTGASSSATELVEGVISEEEPLHDNMPRSVEDATIAMLDLDLEVRESGMTPSTTSPASISSTPRSMPRKVSFVSTPRRSRMPESMSRSSPVMWTTALLRSLRVRTYSRSTASMTTRRPLFPVQRGHAVSVRSMTSRTTTSGAQIPFASSRSVAMS